MTRGDVVTKLTELHNFYIIYIFKEKYVNSENSEIMSNSENSEYVNSENFEIMSINKNQKSKIKNQKL